MFFVSQCYTECSISTYDKHEPIVFFWQFFLVGILSSFFFSLCLSFCFRVYIESYQEVIRKSIIQLFGKMLAWLAETLCFIAGICYFPIGFGAGLFGKISVHQLVPLSDGSLIIILASPMEVFLFSFPWKAKSVDFGANKQKNELLAFSWSWL